MYRIDKTAKDGERLHNRVYNWKFLQALQYLMDQPGPVERMVRALAQKYGDVGHWNIDDPAMEISHADHHLISAILHCSLLDEGCYTGD